MTLIGQELQYCREDLERLKAEGLHQSSLTGRQQQAARVTSLALAQEIFQQKREIEDLRVELAGKQAVASRYEEARTDLVGGRSSETSTRSCGNVWPKAQPGGSSQLKASQL